MRIPQDHLARVQLGRVSQEYMLLTRRVADRSGYMDRSLQPRSHAPGKDVLRGHASANYDWREGDLERKSTEPELT